MHKILFENTSKSYDSEHYVIEDLNLAIEEGSFTVLLGPSGCGKSTVLRMIAGLEELTEGSLTIDGKNMNDTAPGDRKIAMVFQNYALYPTMTVWGNIEFGLINAGIPREERKRRIREIAEVTGLSEYLKRKPGTLSGGQRQRVALARAMVKKPEVFLMDEPLSNLDAKLRVQLRTDLISLYQKLKSTFVYVTHDQVEALSMGTHIVLLNEGKIMQEGSPEEIYCNPANVFTAKFIGTPAMNILPRESLLSETSEFPESTAWIGFRPEHVQFQASDKQALELEGTILTREMLGAEVLYQIETPFGVIKVRDYSIQDHHTGAIQLRVLRQDLCFFDAEEQRIYEGGGQQGEERE